MVENTMLGNPDKLFSTTYIPFVDIHDFMRYYCDNTLVIPVCGSSNAFFSKDQDSRDDGVIPEYNAEMIEAKFKEIDEDESLTEEQKSIRKNMALKDMYDYRLMTAKIYRGDGDFDTINIKKLPVDSYESMEQGLLSKVVLVVDFIRNGLNKLSKIANFIPISVKEKNNSVKNCKLFDRIANECRTSYDKYMHGAQTLIWIPLWKVADTDGIIVSLFGRIDILLT